MKYNHPYIVEYGFTNSMRKSSMFGEKKSSQFPIFWIESSRNTYLWPSILVKTVQFVCGNLCSHDHIGTVGEKL